MTSSVGSIKVGVTADGDGFERELQAAVAEAIKEVQRALATDLLKVGVEIEDMKAKVSAELTEAQKTADANPIKVKLEVDLDASSLLDLQTIQAMTDKTVKVKVDVDHDATAAADLATIQALADKSIKVKADIEMDAVKAAALKDIKDIADKTVKIKADIEVDDAKAAALKDIKNLTDKTVKVRVDVDMTDDEVKRLKELGPTLRSLRTLTDKSIKVKVDVDMTDDEVKRLKELGPALRGLRTLTDKDVRIKVRLDMTDAELQRLKDLTPALRSLRNLSDKDVKIKIRLDVDEAQLRRVAELMRQLRSHQANVRVNTNADEASNALSRLHQQLRGLDTGALGASAIAAALAGIVGAAGAAAGAIGGLVVAAAALGPAVAAGIGVAVVGMQGMKDAFDAVADASDNSAKEAQAQADKVASANNQVASAERSLRQAKQAAKDIEEDLTRARKAATEQLEDMHRSARTGVLDERQAVRDLRKARQDLAKVNPADRDAYAEAVDNIARAEIRLEEIRDRNKDNAEDLAAAEKKGIENSDQVVAVRKQQASAEDAVAAAQAQLTQAQTALTQAQTDALPSQEKLNEALAKLSPNAQAFVLAARELAPAWEEVRKSVQDNLFAGLDDTMTNLADTVMPSLQTGMGGVATQMNLGAKGFADFLSSTEGVAGLEATFASTQNFFRGLREGSDGFMAGLSQMMAAFAPVAETLGRAFGSIGSSIGDAFSHIAQSGLLQDVINGLSVAFEGLGPMLASLLVAFAQIGESVLPTLGPLFEALGDALLTMAPSLGMIGAVFAESLTDLMPYLADFISELAGGLAPVLPVIAELLAVMLDALQPLIGPLSDIAAVVGNALADAISALAPALGPLATAFADIVKAVSPLIPLFADSLSAVLQALAPAISDIAVALAPVIAQFATEMGPVIERIAPVLAEVATTIGMALADGIRQLAPMLPGLINAFIRMLDAVLPLLPEFARLAAELLPPLLDILIELSPVLIRLIDNFTWLVDHVLKPIVLPIIRELADVFKLAMENIADSINWLDENVFPKLDTAINTVKGWFDKGVKAIKDKWAELKEGAADPIRFVVNTVWNDGLRKAWNTVADFLPGLSPMEPVVLGFRSGGAVHGAGSGTSDSIPAYLSNNEHVIRAMEVAKAGGHAVWYAIRDMIARGVPFQWDGAGQVISLLGRDNLAAYGTKVRQRGIGNVSPEGLFDPLLPRFRAGGAVVIQPWMHQLKQGHEFARAQDGRAYQWAGPRWVGDSFDCSGLMGSIIAAITGDNPWRRYWATSSFAGYPQRGAQGLIKGLTNGVGMLVGITDNPGGPGGGHTAGELRGIPELGIPAARVESGGADSTVKYGRGTPVGSFASMYGLPIGANGFFQPSQGGFGPSTDHQRNFIQRRIADIITGILDPVEASIPAMVGTPPPRWREIPPAALTQLETAAIARMTDMAANLGDLLPSAWEGAQRVVVGGVGRVVDALNPFRRQRGGAIPGTGTGDIVPALLEPGEIVMNRRAAAAFGPWLLGLNRAIPRFQTGGEVGGALGGLGALLGGVVPVKVVNFADLTAATGTASLPAAVTTGMEDAAPVLADATVDAVSTVGQQVVGDIGSAFTDVLTTPAPGRPLSETEPADEVTSSADEQTHQMLDEQYRVLSDTRDLIERTSSSQEQVVQTQLQQVRDQVLEVTRLLGADVFVPTVQSAMDAALGVLQSWLGAGFAQVRQGSDQTTRAVYETGGEEAAAAAIPFGQPGSAFDAVTAISEAVTSVADSATQAFNQVAQDIANAALAQKPSRVGNSKGVLGQDISGGPTVDMIVKLTGAVIEIEETLTDTLDEVKQFRGDLLGTSDEQGRIISDTAALMQRNQSSVEKVMNEQNRINRELIKAVLRYLMTAVVIPIMTAILGAMIQLAVTALGAAIGSIIPGIGTIIGAAIGAVVGAALAGVAAVFTSTLAMGAGAAIDSFDRGGLAVGKGLLVKDTNLHERMLNPRETASYDRLGRIADHLEASRGRQTIVHAPINMSGSRATPEQVEGRLLKLMPKA